MELADLVVINKADIDPDAATRAQAQIQSSLRLLGLHGNPEHAHHNEAVWHPGVIQLSALKEQGIDQFWQQVERFRKLQTASGQWAQRRVQQAQAWMWERIEAGLRQRFRAHPAVQSALAGLQDEVVQGRVAASVAARRLLDMFT